MTKNQAFARFLRDVHVSVVELAARYELGVDAEAAALHDLVHMTVREIKDIDNRLHMLRELEKASRRDTDVTLNQIAEEIEHGPNWFLRDILAPGVTPADLDEDDTEPPKPRSTRRGAKQTSSRTARTGTGKPASS